MLTMRDLPYPRTRFGLRHHWRSIELSADLYVTDGAYQSWLVPKGTPVRIMQSKNFGWCVIPARTRCARSSAEIPRTIFKY
jgi:hypothetical protein